MSNSEKVKSSQLSLRGFLAGVQGLEPWALGFGDKANQRSFINAFISN